MATVMDTKFKPVITVFYCINALGEEALLPLYNGDLEMRIVKLPCTSMVKDVFLLKAFEAGSDAVAVFACPEGKCRHVDGNIRARKRVEWLKKLLDEIELDGRRLSFFNLSPGDETSAAQAIQKTLSNLDELGPVQAA